MDRFLILLFWMSVGITLAYLLLAIFLLWKHLNVPTILLVATAFHLLWVATVARHIA